MANLPASAVTFLESWVEHFPGKAVKRRRVTVTLSTQGGTTNTIPASLFDLSVITGCSSLTASDNSLVITAAPSYDGSILLLKAAGTNVPADYASGTYLMTIEGY